MRSFAPFKRRTPQKGAPPGRSPAALLARRLRVVRTSVRRWTQRGITGPRERDRSAYTFRTSRHLSVLAEPTQYSDRYRLGPISSGTRTPWPVFPTRIRSTWRTTTAPHWFGAPPVRCWPSRWIGSRRDWLGPPSAAVTQPAPSAVTPLGEVSSRRPPPVRRFRSCPEPT